ncbi:MAG: hypothetical protein RR533_02730 [Carnobacterium sp.]
MSLLKDIWIAPFIREYTGVDSNLYKVYGAPFQLKCSINSLNGDYEFTMYGERVNRMCKIMPNFDEYYSKIHEKDRAYLYGASPTGEIANGDNANYYVKNVLPQNIKMTVYLEKL